MKGQKSLAMIFSMILMTIVLLMVVNLLDNTAGQVNESPVLDTRLEEVRSSCSQRCGGIQRNEGENALKKALQYCVKRIDVGRRRLGSGFNSFCGDGARCFNLDSCSYRGRTLDAAGCRELLCENFDEGRVASYFEQDRAEGDFGVGKCELTGFKDSAGYNVSTWYSTYFQGDICG
jgi:hypothetical protein